MYRQNALWRNANICCTVTSVDHNFQDAELVQEADIVVMRCAAKVLPQNGQRASRAPT